MTNRKIFSFLILTLCSFGANATSGNTDKYGCHTSKTVGYHCHTQPASTNPSSNVDSSYNPTLYLVTGITAEFTPSMAISLGVYTTEYDVGGFVSLGVFNTIFYHSNNFKASANLAVTMYSSMTMENVDLRYAPTVSVGYGNNWFVDTALVGGAGRGIAGAVTISKHFNMY